VLWSALVGQHLFKGDNDAATIHNVLNKEISPPSAEGWHPPAIYDEVILRGLARDPAKRFDSAFEMAEALRAAAGANLLGVKQRVSRWVTESFAEELEGRRNAIREVVHKAESEPGIDVQWPEPLPSIAGTASLPSDVSGTQSSTRQAEVSGPTPNVKPSRLRLYLAIGAALALGAVALLMLGPHEKNASGPASRGESSASTALTASPPSATAETARPAAGAPSQTETPGQDLQPKPPVRQPPLPAVTYAPRPTRAEPEPARGAARADTNEAPKPKPPPTSGAADDFEKNPYLHR
jgi:serine/threonine-protein kinase